MSLSRADVLALADEVQPAPSKLLTTANPKVAKSQGFGYLTAILHLSPANSAGFEVCSDRSDICTDVCLTHAGRGSFDISIQVARIRKTKWFRADKAAFMLQLERD